MSGGIHPDARRCPHCGVKFAFAAQEEHEEAMGNIGCVIILVIVVGILFAKCAPEKKTSLQPKLEINKLSHHA